MKWVNAYEEFGNEGLLHSRKKETYTFEHKLHVVELYLSNEVSYQELALSQGITILPFLLSGLVILGLPDLMR